jgi:hypothetical protein
MFIGHYAVAFAAKRGAPATSLGTLFLSAQLVDQLWPIFLLLGLEHVRIDPGNTVVTPLDLYDYPISHSLIGSLGWAAGLGALYYAIRKQTRGALIVGLCVFSHWILDFITHRPDMPLGFGGTTYVGLGLWNSLPGTLIVELGVFLAGLAIYLRTTHPKDRIGTSSFWGLVAFLLILYFTNILGPPPPSVTAIAVGANAGWLLIAWAYWIDRHRTVQTSEGQPSK